LLTFDLLTFHYAHIIPANSFIARQSSTVSIKQTMRFTACYPPSSASVFGRCSANEDQRSHQLPPPPLERAAGDSQGNPAALVD
jgi:hypothetical protein